MRPIDLSSLVRRLSDLSRRQLEGAAGMALSRTQYDVEAEHWFLFLLREKQSDLACILEGLEIDPVVLDMRLEKAINGLKTGNGRTPSLSPEIVRLMKTAWLAASVERGAVTIRSVDLLVALATDTDSGSGLRKTLAPLIEALARCSEADLLGYCQNSAEATSPASTACGGSD